MSRPPGDFSVEGNPEREGVIFERITETGAEVTVYPMLFGNGRICVGVPGEGFYDDAWCCPSVDVAVKLAEEWDGTGDPPDGWHRHPASGRRRLDGDPEQEYVRR